MGAIRRQRLEEAQRLADRGFTGPFPPGEARALAAYFRSKPEYAQCVTNGWVIRCFRTRRLMRKFARTYMSCSFVLLFRTPRPDVPMAEFVKLACQYRGKGKTLTSAIDALIKDPDAGKTLEGMKLINALGKL